jgi:hypothetical protein
MKAGPFPEIQRSLPADSGDPAAWVSSANQPFCGIRRSIFLSFLNPLESAYDLNPLLISEKRE